MNALMTQQGSVAQQVSIESFADQNYEHLYAFFNAFYDDAALCLEMVDKTLRDAESAFLSKVSVYTQAVARVNSQPGMALPVWTSSYESNLAWLLRDIGGLRYAEIGQILEMGHTDVKERIAEVRFTVLEHLAA